MASVSLTAVRTAPVTPSRAAADGDGLRRQRRADAHEDGTHGDPPLSQREDHATGRRSLRAFAGKNGKHPDSCGRMRYWHARRHRSSACEPSHRGTRRRQVDSAAYCRAGGGVPMSNVRRLPGPIADVGTGSDSARAEAATAPSSSTPTASAARPATAARRRPRRCAARARSGRECAAHALAVREPYGVWGGFSEAERLRLLAVGWEDLADRRHGRGRRRPARGTPRPAPQVDGAGTTAGTGGLTPAHAAEPR